MGKRCVVQGGEVDMVVSCCKGSKVRDGRETANEIETVWIGSQGKGLKPRKRQRLSMPQSKQIATTVFGAAKTVQIQVGIRPPFTLRHQYGCQRSHIPLPVLRGGGHSKSQSQTSTPQDPVDYRIEKYVHTRWWLRELRNGEIVPEVGRRDGDFAPMARDLRKG